MKTSRIADEDSVSKEIKYTHTYIHSTKGDWKPSRQLVYLAMVDRLDSLHRDNDSMTLYPSNFEFP